MNSRFKNIGKFTFHFATAVYLLALPFFALSHAGDWLLPYEAGLCTSLSVLNGGLAARNAWRAVK